MEDYRRRHVASNVLINSQSHAPGRPFFVQWVARALVGGALLAFYAWVCGHHRVPTFFTLPCPTPCTPTPPETHTTHIQPRMRITTNRLGEAVPSVCSHHFLFVVSYTCQEAILTSNSFDDEYLDVMAKFPKHFSMSMLSSQRQAIATKASQFEKIQVGEVEKANLEVVAAKFKHFTAALTKDQEKLPGLRKPAGFWMTSSTTRKSSGSRPKSRKT